MHPVAIFVATRWELAALRKALPVHRQKTVDGLRCWVGQRGESTYWLIQTGIGPEAAAAAACSVMNPVRFALAISTGLAGALVPAEIGDLIIGTEISSVSYDDGWKRIADAVPCDSAAISSVRALAQQLGMMTRIGSVVSVPTVVSRAEDKQSIGRLTGATALDMESDALARAAKDRAIPFLVIRTVSDLANEDLPLDFNLFLRPTGWMSGLRMLIGRPSTLIGLNKLRLQSNLAVAKLTAVFSALSEVGFGLSPDR